MSTSTHESPKSFKYGGFEIVELSPGTSLHGKVGFDIVEIPSRTRTEIHKHSRAETVMYVISGRACLIVGDDMKEVAIRPGMRLVVPANVVHGFVTNDETIVFASVQSPPIIGEMPCNADRIVVARTRANL